MGAARGPGPTEMSLCHDRGACTAAALRPPGVTFLPMDGPLLICSPCWKGPGGVPAGCPIPALAGIKLGALPMPPLRAFAPALLTVMPGDPPAPDLVGEPLSRGPLDTTGKPAGGPGGPLVLDKGPMLARKGVSA